MKQAIHKHSCYDMAFALPEALATGGGHSSMAEPTPTIEDPPSPTVSTSLRPEAFLLHYLEGSLYPKQPPPRFHSLPAIPSS